MPLCLSCQTALNSCSLPLFASQNPSYITIDASLNLNKCCYIRTISLSRYLKRLACSQTLFWRYTLSPGLYIKKFKHPKHFPESRVHGTHHQSWALCWAAPIIILIFAVWLCLLVYAGSGHRTCRSNCASDRRSTNKFSSHGPGISANGMGEVMLIFFFF